MATTTKAKREKELIELKMYQSNGWDLAEETPEYFLIKRNTQSVGVHIVLALFFWWTFFIPNVIYWLASRQSKKLMK